LHRFFQLGLKHDHEDLNLMDGGRFFDPVTTFKKFAGAFKESKHAVLAL